MSVNDIFQNIHLMVSNLYTLLTMVPMDSKWFLVLDLKNVFSASQEMNRLNYYSPLSCRTQELKPCSSTGGLCYHKDLRIPWQYLGKY